MLTGAGWFFRFRTAMLMCGLVLWGSLTLQAGQTVARVWSAPAASAVAGAPHTVVLHLLNPTDTPQQASLPTEFSATLRSPTNTAAVTLRRTTNNGPETISVGPAGFFAQAYTFTIPSWMSGETVLEIADPGAQSLLLRVQPLPTSPPAAVAETSSAKPTKAGAAPREKPETNSLAQEYFKHHIFGYEPMYFIAGSGSPNAKFQISLRYRLVSEQSYIGSNAPVLTGFNFAYTQTSLWDLDAPSAPFLDSSYMPELLYLKESVQPASWPDWIQLNYRVGAQHESNGRAGLESRSLNTLYFQPTLFLGYEDRIFFSLSPRVHCYVGELDDNSELLDYRGYGSLRATVGIYKFELIATGRLGDDAQYGSLQLDATYPLMNLASGGFGLFLHAQYFTGYGESLLYYSDDSSMFRIGFSLFR